MKTLFISDANYAIHLKKYNHKHDAAISTLDSLHYEYGLKIKDNFPIHYMEFFTDTENCRDPEAPTKKQIENIIFKLNDFIKNDAVNNVLIHCFAGMSRSTALGIVFLSMQDVSPECAYNQIKIMRGGYIHPNLLVLRYADEVLGYSRDDGLVSKIAPLKGEVDLDYIYNGF